MPKSIKLKNNTYIDSTGIVHNQELLSDLLSRISLMAYPVGSIYISVNNTNPSTLFGGTWVAFGTGKTLVGIDTSQTEFNSVEKTGGSKYLQAHTHTTTLSTYNPSGTGWYYIGWLGVNNNGRNQQTYGFKTGGVNDITTGDSGNLQPYITVYMWKRTA